MIAVDRGTKSVIVGKHYICFGQTTATGGLLQSHPCVQPSKLKWLQEKEKEKKKKKHKHHTEETRTGSLVSLQHDGCRCGSFLLVQSPLPQRRLIPQQQPDYNSAHLAYGATTLCTLGSSSAKMWAETNQLSLEQQLFNQASPLPEAAPGIKMRQMSFFSQ